MDRKLPVAREALTRLGWNLMPHQAGITRKDHAGRQRLFVFGRDNPRVLRLWFEEAYTCQGAHASDRIRIGHHRADPSCARGLDLPKPPRHAAFSFRSHRRIFFAPDSLAHKRASVAAGGSYWYAAHLRKCRGGHAAQTRLCLCGGSEPSRAHVTWVCPQLSSLRT